MRISIVTLIIFSSFFGINQVQAENGYDLWLRYYQLTDTQKLNDYRGQIRACTVVGNSPTITAVKDELFMGLQGLLGKEIADLSSTSGNKMVIAGNVENIKTSGIELNEKIDALGNEGYYIFTTNKGIVITGNTDIGVLYGTYHFLRLIQTLQSTANLNIKDSPKCSLRMLNHWTYLNSGGIWNWNQLFYYVDPRVYLYARANASIGINSTVLNSVNASPSDLETMSLERVAIIANTLRPYGIKVFMSVNFNSPKLLGGLITSDPLNPEVQQWWNNKVDEIYNLIPDFGGFLVKANSEHEPGPLDYGRMHYDGANLLATALEPHGGVLIWRAFVYNDNDKDDRAKQPYNEFQPLDGKFKDNVMIQVKNGPVDFQPREPFHPLFGKMPNTPIMMEFQIFKEYLGQLTSLVYLAPLYEECLDADTYAKGKGSTVGKVVDGSLEGHKINGMAGVSNILASETGWTTHPFDQANWYAFGRLAWDHNLSSGDIAEEWVRMTFSNDDKTVGTITDIMMRSRETAVNYMMPLGLHHIFSFFYGHYGPGPWVSTAPRPDWNCTYYNQADIDGIGFDRTATGTNAVSQYTEPVAGMFSNPDKCPEEYLLWFHHLPWDYKMRSGNTLWNELCYRYYEGVEQQKEIQKEWNSLTGKIDDERFGRVAAFLNLQVNEAIWWRNACVLYFQTRSQLPIPRELERPDRTLDFYLNWTNMFPPLPVD